MAGACRAGVTSVTVPPVAAVILCVGDPVTAGLTYPSAICPGLAMVAVTVSAFVLTTLGRETGPLPVCWNANSVFALTPVGSVLGLYDSVTVAGVWKPPLGFVATAKEVCARVC